jgi:hypothetical protein
MAFGGHPAGAETPTATTVVAGVQLSSHGQHMYRRIRRLFPDAPYMVYVANCESTGLVHRSTDGRLRPNLEGGSARGVFQVLMRVHRAEFERRGLNPNRDDDYFQYVRFLYDTYGLKPWAASRSCWEPHYRRLTTS